MALIKSLMKRYRSIIVYILCSLFTAAIETALSWLLIRLTGCSVVIANTAGVIAGAAAHYFLTLAFVFELKSNVQSALGYIVTFACGLLLQNLIIWLVYEQIFNKSDIFFEYLISKGLSLAIPFCLTYYLRKRINQAVASKQENRNE